MSFPYFTRNEGLTATEMTQNNATRRTFQVENSIHYVVAFSAGEV